MPHYLSLSLLHLPDYLKIYPWKGLIYFHKTLFIFYHVREEHEVFLLCSNMVCITFNEFSWIWFKLSFVNQNETWCKLMYVSVLNIISYNSSTELNGMLITPISKSWLFLYLGIKVELLQALRHAKLRKVLNTSAVKKKVALTYLVNLWENNFYKCSKY